MNVVVNGLMTNYQKFGKGKVLVLLHGWADSGKTFVLLSEALKKNYTLLILNLPGFGGTQTPPDDWGLDDYVEFVRDWLAKIGDPAVYGYIGHSYGGAVAIKGLGTGRLASDKLVLIASAGIRRKKKLYKNLLKLSAKILKLPLYLVPPHQRKKLKRRAYNRLGSEVTLLPHMENIFRRIIAQDVADDAAHIKIPVLLVYGSEDKQTPLSDGQILHSRIADSRLEVIDGADHFAHQTNQKVAELVGQFLGAR